MRVRIIMMEVLLVRVLLLGRDEVPQIFGGFDRDHFGFLGVGNVDVNAIWGGHHLDGVWCFLNVDVGDLRTVDDTPTCCCSCCQGQKK